ncbi:MAG: hypothetical protein ACXACB_05575, partial [Promethearchaeota archaeon]
MVRSYLLTLKIINLGIIAWIYSVFFLSIFDFDVVLTTADDEFVLLAFIGAIRNVFSYIIYGVGLAIAYVCAFATAGVYSTYIFNFIETYFESFLSNWFSIGTPSLTQIPNLMLDEVGGFFNDLYLFAFQLLFVISVIYAIRSFFKSDPKNHLKSLG